MLAFSSRRKVDHVKQAPSFRRFAAMEEQDVVGKGVDLSHIIRVAIYKSGDGLGARVIGHGLTGREPMALQCDAVEERTYVGVVEDRGERRLRRAIGDLAQMSEVVAGQNQPARIAGVVELS